MMNEQLEKRFAETAPQVTGSDHAYNGFISYRQTPLQTAIAVNLQRGLHRLARPLWRSRALRVFRDTTSLAANPDLWGSLRKTLDQSDYLIVIASPESVQSPWVRRELDHWLRTRDTSRIVIVHARGRLVWREEASGFDVTETTALPAEIAELFNIQPLWIDLTWIAENPDTATFRTPRFADAVATIAATLHDKPKDEIYGEDVRQRKIRERLAGAALTLVTLGFIAATYFAVNFLEQRDTARNNQSLVLGALAGAEARDGRASEAAKLALAAWPRRPTDRLEKPMIALENLSRSLANLTERVRITRHRGSINAVAFSPDGRFIATGSDDGTARLWDAFTGTERAVVYQIDYGSAQAVAFSPSADRLAIGSSSGEVAIWDMVVKAPVTTFPAHSDGVVSLEFAPDGKTIVTGSTDGSAQVLSVASGLQQIEFLKHAASVYGVALSHDGAFAASAGGDNAVRIWSTETGSEAHVLNGHSGNVFSVAFAPKTSDRLVSSGGDGIVIIWDVASGIEMGRFKAHADAVKSVAFSPNGDYLATGSEDGTIKLWRLDGRELRRFTVYKGHVNAIAFSPDGSRLSSGSWFWNDDWWGKAPTNQGGLAQIWDATTGLELRQIFGGDGDGEPAALSRSDKGGLTALLNGEAQLHAISLEQSGEPVVATAAVGDDVIALGASSDLSFMIEGRMDGSADIVRAEPRAGRTPLKGHRMMVYSVAISHDQRRVATGSADGSARVFDATTGKPIITFAPKASIGTVFALAFSPDDALLVVGAEHGEVVVINLASGASVSRTSIFQPGEEPTGIYSVAFSQNGDAIAIAAGNGDIGQWKWRTDSPIEIIARLSGPVEALVYSDDGERLAVGDATGLISIYDAASLALIVSLRGETQPITDLRFSADGSLLASLSRTDYFSQGSVRLWQLSPTVPDPDARVGLPKGDVFRIACTWLPIVDGAGDFSLTPSIPGIEGLAPICDFEDGYSPPLP